jgi:hypothetical protein
MSFLNLRHLRNTFSRGMCHLHSEGPEPRVIPPHYLYSHGNVPDCGGEQAYIYTRFFLLAFSGIARVLLLFNSSDPDACLSCYHRRSVTPVVWNQRFTWKIWRVHRFKSTSKRIRQQGRHAEKKIQGGYCINLLVGSRVL